MELQYKLILFQLLVFIPFGAGMAVKRYITDPRKLSIYIVTINLVVLEPIIALWTIWGIVLTGDLAILPLGGLLMAGLGFVIGMAAAALMKIRGKRRTTYIISSSLANHGITMGGFFCYILLGDSGFALSLIFLIYFMPFIFLCIFPYARKSESDYAKKKISPVDFILDKRNMPLLGIVIALMLLGAGIDRPSVNFPAGILIMISVALYYFSLGITAIIKSPRFMAGELLIFSFVKFVVLPAILWILIAAVGLHGDVGTVLLVESMMPAAIYSVLTSLLFDLDTELASMLFIYNTVLFALIMAPLILFGFLAI